MHHDAIITNLFRTEHRKITAVLVRYFGFEHIETAEDIVSETFLSASENWKIKGQPENPAAWLYAVAKNKAKDHLKRDTIFNQKIQPALQASTG
jgi:RNA polymerase sigma-70 factor (ECF subfamily)